MKINFVLNYNGISGGVKAVCMFANELYKLGHDVKVIYPLIPPRIARKSLISAAKEIARNVLDKYPQPWTGLAYPVYSLNHLPAADVNIATHWETAEYVLNTKSDRYYLIQDDETWYGNEDKVRETYGMGLKNIVHSQWLKNIVQGYASIYGVIPHAPDHNYYYANRIAHKGFRILICYRHESWKGIDDALKACESIIPDKQIVMFGLSKGKLPENIEFHENPSQFEISQLYNSSDVFIFPSHREGWGMPPMEAMACGTPVISTKVGAVPEYSHAAVYMIPPKDVESMANALTRVAFSPELRKQMSFKGILAMQNYTWEKSAKMLERIIKCE